MTWIKRGDEIYQRIPGMGLLTDFRALNLFMYARITGTAKEYVAIRSVIGED